LALAARCAGEQNKFWEMHDIFFANQEKLSVTDAELRTNLLSIASDLQLDSLRFTDCLNTQKYLSQIRRDFEDGESLQIDGTPTWFINEGRLTGYVSEDKFLGLIDELVK
jgi:protein-disulfide isomerase